MASSDEEGEIVPDCLTNYHLVDCNEEPVSFSVLPLQWGEDDIFGALNAEIFLRGTADDGLQHIYKKVVAWRFELSYALPEIHVLSKDKIWIKLLKPQKSYTDTIRTILITVHFLHFVKKNPDTFGEIVWNYIRKSLSAYEVLPSEDDLIEHMSTIKEAARRDKDLSSSKSFNAFFLETSQKRIHGYECKKRPEFIIGADSDADSGADDDTNEYVDEQFDHVCALCDDGGELLCCEGRCIRSFHPTVESGAESLCESLAYRNHQAIHTFLCKNCRYQRHQCFACGLLGSSDKSTGAESFYLPGSINVHNQQMEQWNIVSPPLYLWSRPDWTATHKAVAMEHGHIRKDSQMSAAERNKVNTGITNYLMQETRDCYGDFSDITTSCGDINSLLDDIPEISIDAEYNQNQHFGVPEQEYGLGNSQEVLGYEGKDENETSQAEDMCIDMDLSP